MNGEKNLQKLIAGMNPRLRDTEYVFATADITWASIADFDPVCAFQEKEGKTLILEKHKAEKAGISYNYTCRMITLEIHSALEAMGFLASITQRLAENNLSVNVVSGYYHDHLFVAKDSVAQVMSLLNMMVQEHNG